MVIDALTRLYLLIGNPVSHSLSPLLHNTAFRELGLNAVYLACPVEPGRVGEAVAGIRALAAGCNVTAPYKDAVIPFLDQISPSAAATNSVNTVLNRNGVLYGTSTDGPGFVASLKERVPGYDFRRPVIVLGAGGAARAVAYSLACEGAGGIYIFNRDPQRGRNLADLIRRHTPLRDCAAFPLEEAAVRKAMRLCRLIVYSLPSDLPLFLKICSKPGKESGSLGESLFFDLRYAPARSGVMKAFQEAGGRACSGRGMLFHQAVLANELFTGCSPPAGLMFDAFEKAGENHLDH